MTPEQAAQVRRLFEAALEIEAEHRSAWLSQRASGALLAEVERLLHGHDSGTDVLNRVGASIAAAVAPAPARDFAGRHVGPYELIEPIGHGGMGAVYRAARADDAFRKFVAVKLLGFQCAGPEMELAFRLERQILASLEHSNIARLMDGGATSEGLLYIVMELVEGVPIDQFCERNALPLDRRLELFEKVCSAVDHAHRNLVVHRDLKPSNILVTKEGEVKLVDFGIAKVLGGALASSPGGALPTLPQMTPLYASPEQIQQRPITTASDVYSLGVVLYVLLTDGVHPYERSSANLRETLAAICERDPQWPSAVAKSVFRRELAGDLDHVVLKAMAKEPAARYSSVGQLAEDLRRYRAGLPVAATGDAVAYRFGKFLRRNRTLVALAAVLLLMMSGGIVSTLYQAGIATRERVVAERRAREAEQARNETEQQRKRAEQERERAETRTLEADRMRVIAERRHDDVRSLATTILFGIYDNIRNLAGSAQARKLALDKSLQYLEVLAKESPGNPALQSELAAGYERAGELMGSLFDINTEGGRAAVPILEKALALRRGVVEAQPRDAAAVLALATTYYAYANAQFSAGRTDDAISNIERGLGVARAAAGDAKYPRVKATLQSRLCALYNLRSDVAAMLALCQQTVGELRRLSERQSSDREIAFSLAATEGQLGNALRVQGRPEESVPLLRLASTRMRALIAADANDIRPRRALAGIQMYLTQALGAIHDGATPTDWAEAVAVIESTLKFDPNDYRTRMYLGYALDKYSAVLRDHRREREAEAVYDRLLNIYRETAAKPKAGPIELSDLSAALSRCPFPSLQNADLALDLAQKANQSTDNRNPVILHSLALAYFSNGQTSKAIETARYALSLLTPPGPGLATGLRKEISDSIAEFEKRK